MAYSMNWEEVSKALASVDYVVTTKYGVEYQVSTLSEAVSTVDIEEVRNGCTVCQVSNLDTILYDILKKSIPDILSVLERNIDGYKETYGLVDSGFAETPFADCSDLAQHKLLKYLYFWTKKNVPYEETLETAMGKILGHVCLSKDDVAKLHISGLSSE